MLARPPDELALSATGARCARAAAARGRGAGVVVRRSSSLSSSLGALADVLSAPAVQARGSDSERMVEFRRLKSGLRWSQLLSTMVRTKGRPLNAGIDHFQDFGGVAVESQWRSTSRDARVSCKLLHLIAHSSGPLLDRRHRARRRAPSTKLSTLVPGGCIILPGPAL